MNENMKLEMDFSQQQLNDILHKHGCFATVIKRIRYHLKKHEYTVFAPSLPDSLTIDDFKTVIDLASITGFETVIIPNNDYYESLKNRAYAHSTGRLSVEC